MAVDKNKFDSETAVAKIKILISRYFESIGRGNDTDNFNTNFLEGELIDDIDDIVSNTNIDRKRIIIESLEMDKVSRY